MTSTTRDSEIEIDGINKPVAEWLPLSPGVDYCTTKHAFVIELDTTARGVESWGPDHLTVEDFKPCHPHTEGLPVEVYEARTADYNYVLLHQLQHEPPTPEWPIGNSTLTLECLLRFKRVPA
tara:strand:+ start:318 stop:683 length:366 start_codon:yes stop_codon:yes gene_type:complete